MSPKLFEPVTLGPLRLRNRFIKSATNEGMAKGGVPSRALVKHHADIAAGGVGMTTVAYCAISADGRTFPDQVQLDEPSMSHLRALTEAVHAQGAAICAQITHGGAFTFVPELSTRYPLSASGGLNPPGFLNGRLFKTAMTPDDLERMAQQFADGARRARDAGFDAVEIHMGHGYLLSQFLSPKYNRRQDAYGGDATGRARFPAQVLRRVLDAVGDRMMVSCKLSVDEGFKGGAKAADSAIVARELEREGAHLLVLSGGMNVESPWAIFGSNLPIEIADVMPSPLVRLAARLQKRGEPKIKFREMYLLEHSRQVRAAVKLPLGYLGGVKSLAGAQQALDEGFDMVVMGRALIHEPQLINQFREGSATESGCNSCNRCVPLMYTAGGTGCVLRGANDVSLNRQPAAGA